MSNLNRVTELTAETVVRDYVAANQMFTVYNVYQETNRRLKAVVPYALVRHAVESLITDGFTAIAGWTRTVGHHLTDLDGSVGKKGQAPQIYHPVGADIKKYTPNVNSPTKYVYGQGRESLRKVSVAKLSLDKNGKVCVS